MALNPLVIFKVKTHYSPVKLMKILYLYTRPGSYTAGCLRALNALDGVESLLVHYPPGEQAPVDDQTFSGIACRRVSPEAPLSELRSIVTDFQPNALIVSGWIDRRYLQIAREAKNSGILTISGSDTQWRGNVRQYLARWVAPHKLHPAIDVLWVAGARQKTLANHLGYKESRVWDGHFCCDWAKFAVSDENEAQFSNRQRAFIFSARLVETKGLQTLLEAYREYRGFSSQPWELWCAGTGPLSSRLEGIAGVKPLGFLQVEDLAAKMSQASAFILPSHFEPWGLVVQEAGAAGLPLILSHEVGAGEHLLRDGFNGFSVETANTLSLTQAMLTMEQLTATERYHMGRESHHLSRQYLPQTWAAKLVREAEHCSKQSHFSNQG